MVILGHVLEIKSLTFKFNFLLSYKGFQNRKTPPSLFSTFHTSDERLACHLNHTFLVFL